MFFKNKFNINQTNLNFGPQHPAAHGVLRLALKLDGEVVIKCDPHIGLLHRGTEQLILKKPYYLSLPYFDRLDYVSMLVQEHAYCLTIEKSQNYNKLPLDILKTRVILDEITRILNHLLAIACHALDIGSMSPIFWLFEERENFMEVYENVSGARMHAAFYRPIFFNKIIKKNTIKKILLKLKNLPVSLNECSTILNKNKIWKSRLYLIGLTNYKEINKFSLSGILARSCGLKKDLRILKNTKYGFYKFLKINSYYTINGDNLSRYNLRFLEMFESINIVNDVIQNSYNIYKKNIFVKNYINMEKTIHHFKIWSGTFRSEKNFSTCYVESPKGMFGCSVVVKKNSEPFLCKIRSPSYNNLLWLKYKTQGQTLQDLISMIGTIDIVFGEIDR